jgi:hypothetical protein
MGISLPILIFVNFLFLIPIGYLRHKIIKDDIEPFKISIRTILYAIPFMLSGIIINLLIIIFHLPTRGYIVFLYILVNLVLFFILLFPYNYIANYFQKKKSKQL